MRSPPQTPVTYSAPANAQNRAALTQGKGQYYATPRAGANLGPMPQPKSESGVEISCMAYQDMIGYWSVINAVRGGTAVIRQQGEAWLPKEPFEKDAAYKRRLSRATFSPWYTKLVRGLVGMVLRRPLTFQDVSEEVQAHLDDVNLMGDDVNVFARDVFECAIDYGYTGIFVDYPRSDAQTLAEQVARGDRPYWVHYTAPEIIGWRYTRIGSKLTLSQLRLKVTETVPDGDFGEKQQEQVKVFDLLEGVVRWRLFQELKDGWEQVEEGAISLPYIPFAFVHTDRKKRFGVQPPMIEIAYLNITHFQKSADLDNALHIAANPKLALFGYDPEAGNISMGVDEALVFESPEGRAEWIAAPPASFDAMERRIAAIEGQMGILGLSALVSPKNVGESAEAKKLDREQSDSQMSVVAQALQDAFDQCLQFHADYLGQPAGTCQVNRKFSLPELSPQAIQVFSSLHSAGQISLETLLNLLKQGEVFDDEFDIEAELRKIEEQMQRQMEAIAQNAADMGG